MKRLLVITLSLSMLFSTAAYASTETGTVKAMFSRIHLPHNEKKPDDSNPDWTIPDTIEMTATATEVFNKAIKGLVGVKYEPLGYLGEKDGTYCILCRTAVVYPGAKPGYALVYVNDAGVQNIWDIWMDKHANNTDTPASQESSYENNKNGGHGYNHRRNPCQRRVLVWRGYSR